MKVEIHRRKTTKFTNMWKLKNTLLNNQWVKDEIKKKILKQTKMEAQHIKTYGTLQKWC